MLKVVFIDDENVTLKLLSRIIDWESEGFTASGTASDGLEGLELCERVRPDVIIVDIRMPRMDGLSFIRELRGKEINTKLIILSAHDEFEYAQKAIPLGVSAYLLKLQIFKKLLTHIPCNIFKGIDSLVYRGAFCSFGIKFC